MANDSEFVELQNVIAEGDTPVVPAPHSGLTTRVVRGSLWNLGGQGVTLLATFVATPFVIRWLGTESYGLLTLISVLLGYLSFADMGMGWASTRFASDAYGRGEGGREARVVWTAAAMAAAPSLLFALVLASAAGPIVQVLRLPSYLQETAIFGLRIAAVGFVARALAGVLNTPELARLRMDLAVLINGGTLVGQILLVPVVLYLGAGLPGAVAVIAGAGILALILHLLVGMYLLPELRRPRVDVQLMKPLAKFGGGLVVTAFATMILSNADKLLLSRYTSVEALAYYAVAFNLSFMLSQAPMAMVQSLLPAFSQLQGNADRNELFVLYGRALRGTLYWVAPVAVFICVIARPFFTAWAGPDFGRESTVLLYVLAGGFVFEAMAYVPFTLMAALGRTDLIARCHGALIIPYIIASTLAIRSFGALGAATVWSLRAVVTLIAFAIVAKKISGFSFKVLPDNLGQYLVSMGILLVPVVLTCWLTSSAKTRIAVVAAALMIHGLLVLTRVLSNEERNWLLRLVPAGPWHRLRQSP